MKAKRFLLGLLVFVVALGALTLDRAPAVPVSTPDAATANAAKALFDRLREAGPGFQPLSATGEEVAAIAALAGRAGNIARNRTQVIENRVVAEASVPAPLGFWLNATIRIAADDGGQAVISATLGRLPVPSWLADAGIWAARNWFSAPGREIPHPDALVRKLEIGRSAVTAEVSIPPTNPLAMFAATPIAPIDGGEVARVYCRLIMAQREQPTEDISRLLNSAFDSAGPTAATNRAAFIAIAMVVVSPEVGRLAGDGAAATSRCGAADIAFTLHGRSDLAKHWALSAAFSAAFGPDTSAIAGVWKELADSADGGSGFSYVDLAADRSGTIVGARASGDAAAKATAEWLARANQAALLPISQLALAEGISEADFTRRYGNIDNARHERAVAKIDRTLLAKLPR